MSNRLERAIWCFLAVSMGSWIFHAANGTGLQFLAGGVVGFCLFEVFLWLRGYPHR